MKHSGKIFGGVYSYCIPQYFQQFNIEYFQEGFR